MKDFVEQMIHQKDGGQVGQTISHYPALRDPARRDKILEKLGEAGLVLPAMPFRPAGAEARFLNQECSYDWNSDFTL